MVKSSMLRLVIASCALMVAVRASAISIELVPLQSTWQLGQSLTVDVVVSGLTSAGEIVSSYDLDLAYMSTVVNATGVIFGSALGGPADSVSGFNLLNGVVDLFENSFLSDAALDALQGDAVTLATLSFDAIGVGTTPLQFLRDFPLDGALVIQLTGRDAMLLPLDAPDASITVVQRASEPSTAFLGALALLLASLFRVPRGGGIGRTTRSQLTLPGPLERSASIFSTLDPDRLPTTP